MSKRKLKVMFSSNAPWAPSGYAQQTFDIEKRFRQSGWDNSNFALLDMFGLGGGILTDKNDIKNYPSIDHIMGSDAMVHHSRHFKADIVISLQDVWPLNPYDLQQVPRFIPWVPVDYDPIPKAITQNLRFANRIISMSKFGEKQLRDSGFSSTYIPHGVDTKIFYPIDSKQRKIEQGINPETFIFGMVSANKDIVPRKSFEQVLDAFAMFLQNHPNSMLYIHTDPEFPGGFPIKQYAEFLGIAGNLAFPDKYKWRFDTSKEEMNRIINTFDVLLSPSSTEGFCIPPIEAQACGVPVIVNDYTAMPELIIDGKTGLKTKVGCKHFFPIGSYIKWPDTQDLYEKMEQMFVSNRVQMGIEARKWVMKTYDWDMLWKEKWLPFLDKIEKEIYGE